MLIRGNITENYIYTVELTKEEQAKLDSILQTDETLEGAIRRILSAGIEAVS